MITKSYLGTNRGKGARNADKDYLLSSGQFRRSYLVARFSFVQDDIRKTVTNLNYPKYNIISFHVKWIRRK